MSSAFSCSCEFVCLSVCLFVHALKRKRLEPSAPTWYSIWQAVGIYWPWGQKVKGQLRGVNLHVDTTARFSNSNTPGTIILAEYSKLDDHSPVTICSLNVICHVYWKMFPYMDLYSCYCRWTLLLRARTGYQRRQSWAERESHNCVLRSSNMKTIIMISEHATRRKTRHWQFGTTQWHSAKSNRSSCCMLLLMMLQFCLASQPHIPY